jgi:hypothetical protein
MTETKKQTRWETVPEFFEIDGGTIINRSRIESIMRDKYWSYIKVGGTKYTTSHKFKTGLKLIWEVEYDNID